MIHNILQPGYRTEHTTTTGILFGVVVSERTEKLYICCLFVHSENSALCTVQMSEMYLRICCVTCFEKDTVMFTNTKMLTGQSVRYYTRMWMAEHSAVDCCRVACFQFLRPSETTSRRLHANLEVCVCAFLLCEESSAVNRRVFRWYACYRECVLL